MGVTRLKRKDRRNFARANNRIARIKQLTATPVIKNVDREEIKKSFEAKA
jgi:CRISPR/Cas system Type II protein with McrA/HNH and RuvC-like nuclease domain